MNNNEHDLQTHSASEEESRRVAEESRESQWDNPGFLRDLFMGKLRLDLVYPFPELEGLKSPEFEVFYQEMKRFLQEEVNSDDSKVFESFGAS